MENWITGTTLTFPSFIYQISIILEKIGRFPSNEYMKLAFDRDKIVRASREGLCHKELSDLRQLQPSIACGFARNDPCRQRRIDMQRNAIVLHTPTCTVRSFRIPLENASEIY